MDRGDQPQYSPSDLLNDRRFIRFVRTGEGAEFWEQWLGDHGERASEFREAQLQLQVILSDHREFNNIHSALLWERIDNSIVSQRKRKQRTRLIAFATSGIAAALLAGITAYWYLTSVVTISTGNAQVNRLILPDGSQVTLNANSSLSYHRAFNFLQNREVELSGEAYFNVRHKNSSPQQIRRGDVFKVSTRYLEVAVLGTVFDVKARDKNNRVSLISGKVSVRSRSGKQQVELSPGQSVTLDSKLRLSEVRHTGISEATTSWMQGKLTVDQTTVAEIVTEFEYIYGYKVVLPDTSYGNKKIDGAITLSSEENFLFVLKNILDANVRKEGRVIYFDKR